MSGSKFAASAPFDGVVSDVDTKDQLITVTPNPIKAKWIGGIDLRHRSKDLDEAAKTHRVWRDYIPVGDYQKEAVYRLTNKSVGIVEDVNLSPKETEIPEDVSKRYKGKKLCLITFTLSPIVVTPNPTVFKYGEEYTRSQGTYLKQDLVVNVRKGDKVKKGDILIYNAGFFTPKTDPFGPGSDLGVDWKHGVQANIAFIETSSTYEDACAITQSFGDKMMMHPAHVRQITLDKNTIIHQCVKLGEEIYSTDPVMIVEDGDLEVLGGVDDPDSVEFLHSLSRQKIKAKYHGRVAEINFLYGCEIDELHPTLEKLVLLQERKAYRIGKKMGKSSDELAAVSGHIRPGTKYQGIEFTENTVLIEFTIVEDLSTGEGDKLCIMTSNKTVVSKVMEKSPFTESGREIDLVFSLTSPYKRIVNSPFINGMLNIVLEDAEDMIVQMYYGS